MKFFLLVAFAGTLMAQSPKVPADPGPKVGTAIPPFSLPDQTGKKQDLSALTGPQGLMLVFYRSADW